MTEKQVFNYCVDKHEGASRKFTDEPYSNHPIRVAENVRKYCKQPARIKNSIIKAAYCHDVVEDTDTTEEQLRADIQDDRAVDYVMEVTSDKAQIETMGKAEYLLQELLNMSDGGMTLKLCDRLDNVADFDVAPEEWVAKYKKQTLYICEGLNEGLDQMLDEHFFIIEAILDRMEY